VFLAGFFRSSITPLACFELSCSEVTWEGDGKALDAKSTSMAAAKQDSSKQEMKTMV
jgi:hypothetical protein